jgi:hypothetical protein
MAIEPPEPRALRAASIGSTRRLSADSEAVQLVRDPFLIFIGAHNFLGMDHNRYMVETGDVSPRLSY